MSYIAFDVPTLEGYLKGLTPDHRPLWGSMNAQQMVEHLSMIIDVAVGRIEMELITPDKYLAKSKAFLMSDKPMPVEYNAPFLKESDFDIRADSFEASKQTFYQQIRDFEAYYEAHPEAIHMHPNFGPLNGEEWHWLQRKHCTHHLKQFGLVG